MRTHSLSRSLTLLVFVTVLSIYGCVAKKVVGPDAGMAPTHFSAQIPCGTPVTVLAVITDPMCNNCIKPEPELKMKPTDRGYQCMTGIACEKLHPVGPEFPAKDRKEAQEYCFQYDENKSLRSNLGL